MVHEVDQYYFSFQPSTCEYLMNNIKSINLENRRFKCFFYKKIRKKKNHKVVGLWKFSKDLWFPHRLPKEITAQERFSHWLFCTIFLKQKNLLKLCKKVASGLSTSFFQKILTFFRGNSEKRSSDGKQQLLVCTNPQTSFVASLYFCFNTRGRIRVRFLIFFVL